MSSTSTPQRRKLDKVASPHHSPSSKRISLMTGISQKESSDTKPRWRSAVRPRGQLRDELIEASRTDSVSVSVVSPSQDSPSPSPYIGPEISSWHQSLQTSSFGSDHGWKPLLPQMHFHSSSPALYDTPSLMKRSNTSSGQCIVAALAFERVTIKESLIREALNQAGWEGVYFAQAGFNNEVLRLEQGVLQEIHLFLESDVPPAVANRLVAILYPFPVTFHTPDAIYHIPELPPKGHDLWDIWINYKIYRPGIKSETVESGGPVDGSDMPSQNMGGYVPSMGGDSSGSGWGFGRQNDDGNSSGGESSDSGNDGAEDGNDRLAIKGKGRSCGTRGISIPFSSTLICGEDLPTSCYPSIKFKTLACVDVEIEDNLGGQTRPPRSVWGGPWVNARMTLLDAGVQEAASSKPLGYSLGLSQIRIMASSCPTSVLQFSPTTTHSEDDNLKTKTERNGTGAIKGTISANPNLRLEGTFGRTSGEEKVQKRWEIIPHCLGSNRNDITGHPQTTMMWKYVHNDKFYQRGAGNTFDSKPSAIFGFSRTSRTLPLLEVEVVMHYSCPTPPSQPHTFRNWLSGLTILNNTAPAFMNFLHQVSVKVDLGKVKQNLWVVGLGSHDIQSPDVLGKPFPPIVEQVESNDMRASECKVSLGRALYGRINFTEEERRDAHPLLHNMSTAPSASWPSLGPSMQSPSSPENGPAKFLTKVPEGYIVDGFYFRDEQVAMRRARVLRNRNT